MVGGNGGKGRKWRSVFTTGGNGQDLQDGGALIVLGPPYCTFVATGGST